jgi:tetratricopeptide (TPR) repeat protein
VAIQKNHDFDLTVPTTLPDVTYVVQYRNPVMAVLSDREYLARLEGQARADDAHEFRVWLGKKGAHFRRFWDKWLARPEPGHVVVEYGELMEHPAAVAQRVLDAAGVAIEAGRLEAAAGAQAGIVADFPLISPSMPFAPRVLTGSRYFDRDLMSVYESMLVDTIAGLTPTGLLAHADSSNHPVRLVYDASLRSVAGAADEASALLRRAAAADPENPYIREELSHARRQANDLEGAIAAAREALQRRPGTVAFLRLLSDLYSTRSAADLDEAIALARTLVEASPADPGHRVHLAALLARRREFGEAALMAAQAMSAGAADANVWRECSEVLSMAGELDGALQAVREALTRVPGQAEYHHHLGNLLVRSGQLADAIQSHTRALALAPHEAYWRAALARQLASAGRMDEALGLLDEGLRIQPGNEHLAQVRRRLSASAVPCAEGEAGS